MRSITIGNFDGVHAGHQALLARARHLAAGGQVAAVTFDVHPTAVLKPAEAVPLVQTLQERCDALRQHGADRVRVVQVTPQLLAMEPGAFIEWLRRDEPFDWIVEGVDFRFGRGRAGDVAALRDIGARAGFQVDAVEPLEVRLADASMAPASSSLLRWLLQNGRVEDAATVMGRPYRLAGRVVRGDQRGRTLGWPTANLEIAPRLIPCDGVYSGIAALPGGAKRRAAISVGTKPTFGAAARTVEAHLLDHQAPLDDYGWTMELTFTRWLREQRRFEGVEALVEQMRRDVQQARREIADERVVA